MKHEIPSIDLDSFIKELEIFKGQGYQLTFSGLSYSRPKHRADKLVQIEFHETVYLDDETNKVVIINQ